MESTISQSATSLWWSNIGKWQVIAIDITLAVYSVILLLTGNKETATIAFAIAFAAFAVSAVAFVVASAYTIAVAFVVVAFAAFAALAFAAFAVAVSVVASVISFIVASVISFIVADEAVKQGISKKVVWLSYVAQFILILLPMLVSILH